MARNVAENLAVLGIPVELLSSIGDDGAGQGLLAGLRARGIGTAHVAVLPGETTAQYVALLGADGELVMGAAVMAVLDRITVEQLRAAWPSDESEWVFCDGNLPAPVLQEALGKPNPVAFDAVSTHKVLRLPRDLSGLALLSCNRQEARAWAAHHGVPRPSDDRAMASVLLEAGADAVLLTRGVQGLVVAGPGVLAELPAVPAQPIDVTGAGDALIGGTLAGLVRGADLIEAAQAGAERAARTVESELSVLPL
ncbi:PfkB family carbohydrate kinase [Kineosporia babensis]|uniref:PfkB family carbohydrate kinase n=1 Tax=Kineosporia babensis TaxID=499548 RepID=A0A9X1NH78_9ACTN|nr:PfkB family carbohydrate kinase [Kineosporia babensis]